METQENLVSTTNEIAELVDSGRTRKAAREISQLSTEELQAVMEIANGVGQTLCRLSKPAIDFISEAYNKEMASQHALELENIAAENAITQAFNQSVNNVEEQIDLTKAETIENFRGYCEEKRKNYDQQMDKVQKRRESHQRLGIFGSLFNKK